MGDSKALAQIQVDKNTIKGSGATGFALWRSVYLSKQVSLRNRVLVVIDWVTSRAFGRGELILFSLCFLNTVHVPSLPLQASELTFFCSFWVWLLEDITRL